MYIDQILRKAGCANEDTEKSQKSRNFPEKITNTIKLRAIYARTQF